MQNNDTSTQARAREFIEHHRDEIRIGLERFGLTAEEALVFAFEVSAEIGALIKAGHPAARLYLCAQANLVEAPLRFDPHAFDPLVSVEIRDTRAACLAAYNALRTTAVCRVWAKRQA